MCKFIHIRNKIDSKIQGKGGCTIAYESVPEGGFLYAMAKCHEKDNFNKHLGRVKAQGRLKSFHFAKMTPVEISEKDFVSSMIRNFSQ